MFGLCLYIIALAVSVYLWGIIRTALWLLPTLIWPELGPVFAASLLSFWLVASFLASYHDRFFDFRGFTWSRWLLLFFASGILGGSLVDPFSTEIPIFSALIPPLVLTVVYLFRHPANTVLYLPQKTKWILTGLWIFCAALRVIENQFIVMVGS